MRKDEAVRPEFSDPQRESAGAVLEVVIEAAAQSVEETKCRVIASLYEEIAFDRAISVADALPYLRLVRDCSWRQLVILRYFESSDRAAEREQIGAAGEEGEARLHPALGVELAELANTLELVGLEQEGGSVSNPLGTFGGGHLSSSSVAKLAPTGPGQTISRLGRLKEVVTSDELDEVAEDLRSDERR